MPQTKETGRQGYQNGYERADEIGALLGADRMSYKSNEFRWNDTVVVIKTGPSAIVTRATLARVDAVVYGELQNNEWQLFIIDPTKFEKLSVPSRSKGHNGNYRQVRRAQIRAFGTLINPPPGGFAKSPRARLGSTEE